MEAGPVPVAIPSKTLKMTMEGREAFRFQQREKQRANSHALGNFRQILIATNVALSYVIVGASVAWAAPVLYDIKKHGLHGEKLSREESLIIGSLLFITMLMTPIPSGILSDRIGRKLTLICGAVISCVSWWLVVFVEIFGNVLMLYFSRALSGLWAGAVLTIVPLYVADVVRPKIRSSLGSISPVMVMLGCELTFALAPNVDLHIMAATCGIMPHIFLILMCYLPESPIWLICSKKMDHAKKNLEWLQGRELSSDVKLREKFELMVKSAEGDHPYWQKCKNLFRDPVDQRAMWRLLVLNACQLFTGVSAMLAYATITIPERNIDALQPQDCQTTLGTVVLVSTLVAAVLLNKVRRIPLLVVSSIGAFFSQASLATWFYNYRFALDSPSISEAHWLPFAFYMGYGLFYVVGIGSVPNVLQGEMLSPKNNNVAPGVAVILKSAISVFVNVMYFIVADTIGWHWNFVFYAFSCLAALFFVLTYIPETKGKKLEEIRIELAKQ